MMTKQVELITSYIGRIAHSGAAARTPNEAYKLSVNAGRAPQMIYDVSRRKIKYFCGDSNGFFKIYWLKW